MQPQAPPQLDWIADSMQNIIQGGNMFRPLAPQHVGLTLTPNPFDSQAPGNANLPYTDQVNPWLVNATVSDTMWQRITRGAGK